jgi:AraC-like DNA-binding protein
MSARHSAEGLKYALAETAKPAETFDFLRSDLGQSNPQHCPHRAETGSAIQPRTQSLGEPLTIHEVAELLGCSVWTVRQRYMPQGLPYLRASTTGKLVFFYKQVIDWILRRQQQKKGGNSR